MTTPELESLVMTLQKQLVVHQQIKASMEAELQKVIMVAGPTEKFATGGTIASGDAVAVVRALRIEHDELKDRYAQLQMDRDFYHDKFEKKRKATEKPK